MAFWNPMRNWMSGDVLYEVLDLTSLGRDKMLHDVLAGSCVAECHSWSFWTLFCTCSLCLYENIFAVKGKLMLFLLWNSSFVQINKYCSRTSWYSSIFVNHLGHRPHIRAFLNSWTTKQTGHRVGKQNHRWDKFMINLKLQEQGLCFFLTCWPWLAV